MYTLSQYFVSGSVKFGGVFLPTVHDGEGNPALLETVWVVYVNDIWARMAATHPMALV